MTPNLEFRTSLCEEHKNVKGHQLQDEPLKINTGYGLAINPGAKLKNYTYTLQDAQWHDT